MTANLDTETKDMENLTYDNMTSLQSKNIIKPSCEVALMDCCPRVCPIGWTMEFSAVQSARVSYGKGLKTVTQDMKLVDYLIREGHTSPLESISFTFRVKCPIYTARQIMRHRTFSFNEYSLRYSKALDELYTPDKFRKQSGINKQSSDGELANADIHNIYSETTRYAYIAYKKLIELGVCREQARGVLPMCLYTTFYATVNLNNLFKFLKLRTAPDAQQEVRDVADSMEELAKTIAPYAFASWKKYNNSINLTLDEIEAIRNGKTELSHTKTGTKKFQAKLNQLGLYSSSAS